MFQCDGKKNWQSYFPGEESEPSDMFLKQIALPSSVDLGALNIYVYHLHSWTKTHFSHKILALIQLWKENIYTHF